jgi:SAM-dependent methyltransferase
MSGPRCGACGAEGFKDFCRTSFLGVDDRKLLECPSCGLTQLWPQPSDAELGQYYGGTYFGWDKAKEDGKAWYFSTRVLEPRPKGRFLDIGCATGVFLAGVKKYSGWDCYGNEFSPDGVAYARKNFGLEVRQGSLEQAGFPGEFFDYVHMNNVLEHVLDPAALLKECARIMKPGAVLHVVTPNGLVDRQGYADFCQKIEGCVGASRDGHLFFYTPKSLGLLAEGAGLQITKAESAGVIRGLRAVGKLPRTPSWFKGYVPRQRIPFTGTVADTVTEGKQRSKAYWAFKFGKEGFFRQAGFQRYAYDFHLQLTKV